MAIKLKRKDSVSDTAPTVRCEPSNNAGAITITGKELEPCLTILECSPICQPYGWTSAGPMAGALCIDGFTRPTSPKESDS